MNNEDSSNLLKQTEVYLQKSKAILAAMEAERRKEDELENLPPEVYLRARKLRQQGKFKRKIVKRTPRDMEWDTAELDCGHQTEVIDRLTDSDLHECHECLNAWLRRKGKKTKAKGSHGPRQ
jgi:hypothetical protein